MSGRFYDDYDEDPWRARLWQVDVERALATRPGLRALVDLRAALLALPEKRLLQGEACFVPFDDEGEHDTTRAAFCAMGAWLYRKRVAAGEPEQKVVEDLAYYGGDSETVEIIANEAKRLGMAKTLAAHIQWINDKYDRESEEHRYERVLAWTEQAIAASPHAK